MVLLRHASSTPSAALLSLIFRLLLLLPTPAVADCECGYTVNTTLYTDLIETDFLHLANITTDTDWQPQNYTVTPALANGPYGKNASLGNVVANPLKSQYDWTGQGVNGGDGGLELIVRGGVTQPGSLVPMAELASARDDILYGSFRAALKVTDVSGTCGAFFWYYNNTQEIDVELLSVQQNASSHPANLVLQSLQSQEAGFNAAGTGTFQAHQLPFDPTDGFHEYRFDWSPDAVTFYADGQLLDTMTKAVPSTAGHITLSHWSTGNADWSAGPPATDAVLTVEYMKGYFNSSSAQRQSDWRNRCRDINAANATCAVPEVTEAPNGNSSAKTFFFSQQRNETVNQTVSTDGKKSAGSETGLSWKLHGVMTAVFLSCSMGMLGWFL